MGWQRSASGTWRAAAFALLATAGLPARAATYAWLDFDGAINGGATEESHKGWIEIKGFGFDARRDVSREAGGPLEAAPPQLAEFTVAKRLDRASLPLFTAATVGQDPYPRVKLDLNLGGGQPISRLELENVFVTSQSMVARETDEDVPTESISLNFTKITYTYILPNSQTSFTSYDMVTGKAESNAGEVNPPDPDSDDDGMLDSWEVFFGLNVGANDAAGDADGDGLSNLDEYQLGTHPKSGSSFFKATLAVVPATPGSYQLSWNSVAGKTYVIEWTPVLGSPFTTVRTVTATAATNTETVTPAGTMGFYRVRPQ
jgi:type VI protein secretion system component Hcp